MSEELNHEVQKFLANISRKYIELGNGSASEEEKAKTEVCFTKSVSILLNFQNISQTVLWSISFFAVSWPGGQHTNVHLGRR